MVKRKPREIREKHRDSGKSPHGNFELNFDLDQPAVTVVVRVKYKFKEGINSDDRKKFKNRFKRVVADEWDNMTELTTADVDGLKRIPIRIVLQENNRSYHRIVNVEKVKGRPGLGMDINVNLDASLETLSDEFGNVLANRTLLRKIQNSLMNYGSRCFSDIAREVSKLTGSHYIDSKISDRDAIKAWTDVQRINKQRNATLRPLK